MSKTISVAAIKCAVALLAGQLFATGIAGAQTAAAAAAEPVHPPISSATLPVSAPLLPASFSVDLATAEGMSAFSAQWRNKDVKIIEVPASPSAPPGWKSAYDLVPKAGPADFDDSSWPVIEPKAILDHRGGGFIFMTWWRTNLTMPAKIGSFETAGAKAALVVTVDDYAEVWVNGQMPRAAGRPSPGVIQGFNVPNRVMLSESVKPGDKFLIAIMGINGPLSVAPGNAVFVRDAHIEFFK